MKMTNNVPDQDNKPEQGTGEIFLEELSKRPGHREGFFSKFWAAIQIPFLAIISGLFLGAVIIILTSSDVYSAFGEGFWAGIKTTFQIVGKAYSMLFTGAFGDPARIVEALKTGEKIDRAFKPILQSLVETTPYIFSGLAVADFEPVYLTSAEKDKSMSGRWPRRLWDITSPGCPLISTSRLRFWPRLLPAACGGSCRVG